MLEPTEIIPDIMLRIKPILSKFEIFKRDIDLTLMNVEETDTEFKLHLLNMGRNKIFVQSLDGELRELEIPQYEGLDMQYIFSANGSRPAGLTFEATVSKGSRVVFVAEDDTLEPGILQNRLNAALTDIDDIEGRRSLRSQLDYVGGYSKGILIYNLEGRLPETRRFDPVDGMERELPLLPMSDDGKRTFVVENAVISTSLDKNIRATQQDRIAINTNGSAMSIVLTDGKDSGNQNEGGEISNKLSHHTAKRLVAGQNPVSILLQQNSNVRQESTDASDATISGYRIDEDVTSIERMYKLEAIMVGDTKLRVIRTADFSITDLSIDSNVISLDAKTLLGIETPNIPYKKILPSDFTLEQLKNEIDDIIALRDHETIKSRLNELRSDLYSRGGFSYDSECTDYTAGLFNNADDRFIDNYCKDNAIDWDLSSTSHILNLLYPTFATASAYFVGNVIKDGEIVGFADDKNEVQRRIELAIIYNKYLTSAVLNDSELEILGMNRELIQRVGSNFIKSTKVNIGDIVVSHSDGIQIPDEILSRIVEEESQNDDFNTLLSDRVRDRIIQEHWRQNPNATDNISLVVHHITN